MHTYRTQSAYSQKKTHAAASRSDSERAALAAAALQRTGAPRALVLAGRTGRISRERGGAAQVPIGTHFIFTAGVYRWDAHDPGSVF